LPDPRGVYRIGKCSENDGGKLLPMDERQAGV